MFFDQDFGYVQTTSTEVLKSYVFNEPIVISAARLQTLDPAAIFRVFQSLIIHLQLNFPYLLWLIPGTWMHVARD